MSFTNEDELHPMNLITFIFNVEVSPHVCSFCHGFEHLLTNWPYRSSRVEIQSGLSVALPLGNPPIAIVLHYPNIVPRNFDSHLDASGDRGEFFRFLNPTRNSFPSLEGYGFFPALASKQPYWPMMGHPYQGGRSITTLGWGWACMMLGDNVATPVTTIVKAGGRGPPNANERSFKPSSKGQPKKPSHSTRACEQVLQ